MNISKHQIHRFEWLSAFVRGTAAASLVVLISLASVAEAASIPMLRNVTTDTTIFHDDFESYTVIPFASITPPNNTGIGLPNTANAITGTWSAGSDFGGMSNYQEGVVDQTNSAGNIAAQQGSQFFQISTTLASQGTAMTGSGVNNGSAGDIIAANFAFYLTTGSERALIYLYDGAALLAALSLNGVNATNSTYTLATNGGTTWNDTSLTFAPDVWNTMTIEHELGTANWDLSINGGSSITYTGFQDASGFVVDSINFNQTSASTLYIDAVIPEPSSILLMGLGVVMTMVAIRRRQRG